MKKKVKRASEKSMPEENIKNSKKEKKKKAKDKQNWDEYKKCIIWKAYRLWLSKSLRANMNHWQCHQHCCHSDRNNIK